MELPRTEKPNSVNQSIITSKRSRAKFLLRLLQGKVKLDLHQTCILLLLLLSAKQILLLSTQEFTNFAGMKFFLILQKFRSYILRSSLASKIAGSSADMPFSNCPIIQNLFENRAYYPKRALQSRTLKYLIIQ